MRRCSQTILFDYMKTYSVRMDDEQEAQVEDIARQLHGSGASVIRLAVSTLYEAMKQKNAVPLPQHQTSPVPAEAGQ